MKKITCLLLTLLGLNNIVFGQANVTLQAPPYDLSSTGLSLANGMANVVTHRSCYLILPSELTALALTNSVITAMGIDLTQGCNVATTGQYTVYLQNTSDVTYNKGTTWSTITTGMSTNFIGNITFPVNTGATTIPLTLGPSFTYTGGGIYVACEWFAAAPTATLPARTAANSSGLTAPALTGGGAYGATAVLPAATTLTNTTTFRPCFRFTAANSATNEASVTRLDALGKVSKLFTAGHQVTAQIRNNSNGPLTVPVTLTVSGANPFTDTQIATAVPAGSFATVSFALYHPTANGLSTMSVTIPNDQVNNNNLAVWNQTVTCNDFASIPPLPATTFTDESRGFPAGGIYSYKMTPPSSSSLTGIYMSISTDSATPGNSLDGVVMDGSGSILATTNTITTASSMQNTFVNFTFATPFAMTAGTDYYIGVRQKAGTANYFPYSNILPNYAVTNFYLSPFAAGALTNVDRGYIGIGALVTTSAVAISASATKTIVCKKDGPNTVTLTASGLSTYTWTPGGSGTSIVVTPTVAGASGGHVFSVIGTDAASGCKSANASITVSVSACTALSSNTADGYDLKLFPNPATNGKSTITGLSGTNVVTVFNTLGQVVLTKLVSEDTMSLDLSSQPSGNYLVKITNANSESRTIKVVNQN